MTRKATSTNGSQLRQRVRTLAEILDSGEDPWTLWMRLLARFVIANNTRDQFGDILESDPFIGVDPHGIQDVLSGLSVSEISVVYEFLLAAESMDSKRSNGQFFTPDDVAQFMASKARQLGPGVWLDPCCGVGNLAYWLIHGQPDPEQFLMESMRFVDIDDRALLSARVILAVSFQRSQKDLFSRLEPNFERRDFLSEGLFASTPFDGEYDFVIMNPPYVQTLSPSPNFRSAKSRDMYAFFLERALETSRGVVAVTPQTFTNGRRHADLRQVILDEGGDCTIYCFDNVPDTVFRGFKFGSTNTNTVNSTRAAVLVADKRQRHGGSRGALAITPLIRWRASERAMLFQSVDELLSHPLEVTAELFPKVPRGTEALYEDLRSLPSRLGDLVVKKPAPDDRLRLVVPTTPRYFISAVRRDLRRASMATLSFRTEADFIRAYLTLNSGVAYFWWRVRDGGMTLSRATLFSVPIPQLDHSSVEAARLVERLEESESRNLVVKMNAGSENENVKHPLALVKDVTRFVLPQYGSMMPALEALHANSSLSDPQSSSLPVRPRQTTRALIRR